ncbi:MAG: hypothetical protein NTY19_25825 [Planctomycetota bacterium]|nr:hypothetical protein [Planctomycetota bacterium]
MCSSQGGTYSTFSRAGQAIDPVIAGITFIHNRDDDEERVDIEADISGAGTTCPKTLVPTPLNARNIIQVARHDPVFDSIPPPYRRGNVADHPIPVCRPRQAPGFQPTDVGGSGANSPRSQALGERQEITYP